MKQLKTLKNDENGSALVITMMIFVVLSLLGGSLATVTMGSLQLGDNSRDYNSVYYIAEAGANLAYDDIQRGIVDSYNASGNDEHNYFEHQIPTLIREINEKDYSTGNFDEQFGAQPHVKIKVIPGGERGQYIIQSTGIIEDKKRTVNKAVAFNWIGIANDQENTIPLPNLPEAAVVVKEIFSIYYNSRVEGKLILENGRVFNNYSGYEIKPEYKSNIDMDQYVININDLNIDTNLPNNDLETFGNIYSNSTLETDEDYKIETINLSGNQKLTLNLTNKTNNLVVNKLTLGNGSELTVQGKGSVNIYVMDQLTTNWRSKITKSDEVEELNIVYLGTSPFSLQSEVQVQGNIITDRAGINLYSPSTITGNVITNSGDVYIHNNSKVNGHVITGRGAITLGSASTVRGIVISAKGRTILGNNSSVTGIVITNELTLGSASYVYYSEEFHNDFGVENGNGMDSVTIEDLLETYPAIEN